MANQIRFDIGFNVDKAGLNELQSALMQVQIAAGKATGTSQMEKDLRAAGQAASQLSDILNQSWNNKLGQLDLSKVNNSIKKTFGSVKDLKTTMEKSGPAGAAAYNQVASSILNTNLQLKQSNKLLDEMAVSMANTVKWGITSNIFNNITGSIQKAYGYTKNLDSSLNDIRIVTDKSAESMEKFAIQANEAAKGLGASTLDYTQASLIYYQQGLDDAEVAARAETTLKAANVTGQSGQEVSEQLTAVWNGYKVTAQETELYVDKLAAVAATTAADLEELSTGMSKVASAASLMGVDIDQLNAQLATIVSVTREAPESIGTALKTVYARMSDIKAGLDGETTLDEYTKQMAAMGINALDANGHLRDMGEVVEEIGGKWATLTREQQTSLAQTIAGTRQYSRMMALFDNWDMYTKALKTSGEAAGTLQKQQDIHMESTEAHLQKLSTEAERTYDILFNQDTVNGFADTLTGVLGIFNDFIEGIGGGGKAFLYFGSIVANVFNKQISQSILNAKANLQAAIANKQGEEVKEQLIGAGVSQINQMSGVDIDTNSEAYQAQLDAAKKVFDVRKGLTQQQYQETIEINKQIGLETQKLIKLKQEATLTEEKKKNLSILNVQENTSGAIVRERLNYKEEELRAIVAGKEALSNLISINQLVNAGTMDRAEAERQCNFYLDGFTDLLKQMCIDDDIIIADWEKITNEILEGKLDLSFLDEEMGQINIKEIELNRAISSGNALLKSRDPQHKQEILDQEEKLRILKQQNDAYVQQGAAAAKIQGLVKGATAASGAITALTGAVTSFNQEGATAIDKGQAIGSALSGIAMSAGMALGPIGMAVMSIVSVTISGITSMWSEHKRQMEEAIEENKKQWEELRSNIEDLNSNINTLESLQNEFERLSLGVTKYGENISLTADEYEKYQDIIEQIVGVSPDVVQGYTDEGKAIVNNNGLIEETIKLLQQQQLEQKKLLLEDSSMDTTYEGAQTDYDKAKSRVKTAERKQDNAKSDIAMINSTNQGLDYVNTMGFMQALSFGEVSKEQEEAYKADVAKIRELFLDEDGLSIDTDKFLENRESIYTSLNELQTKYNLSDAALWGKVEGMDISGSSFDSTEDYFTRIEEKINAVNIAGEEIDKAEKDLESKTKALNDKVITWLEVYGEQYSNLGVEQQLAIQQYVQSFTTTDFSQEGFEALQQQAQLFVDKVALLDEDTVNQINELSNPNNFTNYQDYVNAIVNFYKEQSKKTDGLTKDEIMSLFGLSNLTENKMGDEITKKGNEFQQKIREVFGKEDFNIYKYFSGSDIQNANLENFTIGNVDFNNFGNFEEFEKFYESSIKLSQASTQLGNSLQQTQTNIDVLNTSLQEFQTEGKLSEETILDLERRYPQLAAIQDKSSHQYLQLLRDIREQEEDNAKIALQERKKVLEEKAEYYSELLKDEEFQVKANVDEFESTMQQLLDTEYQLEVLVKADLETDVEDAFGIADELSKLQDLVPEDLTVSFEEAQELIAQGYAGILENAQETSEQSIKLDKATMNAFIDNRQAELESDKQAKIGQLENQRALLVTQRDALEKKLKALKEASKAENATDAATALQKAKNADKEYQTAVEALNEELKSEAKAATEEEKINEQLFNDLGGMYETNSENQQQAEKDTTDGQKENITARLKNVKKLYDGYMAVAAARLYSEGNGPYPSNEPEVDGLEGGTEVQITGSASVSGNEVGAGEITPEDISKYAEELFNKDKGEFDATIDALIKATEAQLDTVDQQIGSIDAGIAALLSAGKSLDKAQKESGSGGDKRDEEYKNKEDEIDRYWELNKAIEAVTEELSDLDKKQEKLYGKELIASLKAENELLEQQAERYRALAAEQQREASELQGLLSAYGVVFDAQGGVANYLAASQAALDRYNQAVAAYNAFLIDEATFKAEQRAYENFKSLLDRYEALYYEEMRETQNKLDEIHRQELENNLKAWEVEIQLKLDMSEMERQWEDFFKDINENFKLVYEDLDATMENLANKMKTYQGEDGDIATTLQAIKDVQAEIDKMQNGGESDMFESVSQAQEKLKELNEQLQDSALAMKELWEEAWDTYLEGIDQAADQFDDLMEKYDNINEQIEYQKELIELLYGEEAYDLMDKYYETQQKNTMSEIDSLKQQVDLWKQQYEEALAIDEANGTMSEDTQKFYELWQEAQEELNGKVIDYIDLLQNDYKNAIAGVISDLEKSLTGGSTLDDVKEQWELLQEQADKYYDDVERIYEISNLAGKYETSIANTSELKNQQKLQELYDREMEYLENKKYLTEYDLEVANARYDMALKQIALEEAQQNKNAMKLVRGADGNWSYQYVADEDDIASKQQALLDAANEYYRITKEGYHENLEDMMNAQATYLEKLQEINEIYINDEEMRAQKAQELYEMYYGEGGILTLLYTENEERRTNMADATLQSLTTFYAIDEENYTRMTEVERELIDGLKDGTLDNYDEMLEKAKEVCGETLDAWTSSAQEIANQWYKDGGDSVKAQIIQAYKDMELANKSYQDAIAALEKAVEQNFGEEGITGALNDAQKETEELDDKTEELCDNAESNLDRYREAVNAIGEAWESVKSQIQDAIDLIKEYLNIAANVGSGGNSGDSGSGGGGNSGGGNSGGGSGEDDGGSTKSVSVTMYSSATGGNGVPLATKQVSKNNFVSARKTAESGTYNYLLQLTDLQGFIDQGTRNKIKSTIGLKTGGYTGDWNGGDGRLAFLHSKELVLNARDTENMLAAVNTVRSIANLGDSINQSIMNGIGQMILGLTGLGNYGNYSIGETKESGDTIFEIQANFPNANDVESIREAIMSLPNLASQYIARNKK